jgi:hypothetical protein
MAGIPPSADAVKLKSKTVCTALEKCERLLTVYDVFVHFQVLSTNVVPQPPHVQNKH